VPEIKHIVNRIAVNTLGIATENAFKWRAEVAAYLSDDFPRHLQTILDDLYGPEEQVRINRLELNIDLVKARGTELFQSELIHALRRALTSQKQEAILMNLQDDIAADPGISNRSLGAWFFYLQKGYYPWFHQQVLGAKELELLIQEHTEAIIHQLPVVLDSLQAQQRFIIEINQAALMLLLPFFVKANGRDNYLKKHLYMEQNRGQQIKKVSQLLVKAIVNKEHFDEQQLIEMMDVATGTDQKEPKENKADAIVKQAKLKKEPFIKSKEDADTTIWIQNAGLILLHPFLPVLFDRLSVTNEKKQVTNRAKALALIHYLLHLEADYSDAKMVLPKILCGISYDDPVSMDYEVNEEERKECDELLLSVIAYWEALKNTSIEGLLNAFVLRKGKLSLGDHGWRLQVEKRTEDILLDRLPWSIGYIKLPWMISPLTVEWR